MRSKSLKLYSVMLGLLLLAVGCKNQSSPKNTTSTSKTTLSVIDSRGKTVSLQQPAQRVVVLFPSLLDEVFMLKAGDKVVGVPQIIYDTPDAFQFLSQFDKRLKAKSIPAPTYNGRSVNIETLVKLKPDLVLTFAMDSEGIMQMEQLGIPVFTFNSEGEESILRDLKAVGKLLGKTDRAKTITDYVSEEIKAMRASKIDSPKEVYYVWSRGRVMSTSGPGSLIDRVIRLSGAKNTCPIPIEAPNISPETLYKWNPDLMILWNSDPEEVYKLKELSALPAVKNKQVYVMSPAFPFDPHTVKFLLFAKQLRHWCLPSYTQEELNADIQQAFQVMYGVNYKAE